MREPLNFYTIYEWEDDEKFYKRKGFKPYTTVFGELDGEPFPRVTQYIKNGSIFDVLGCDQCYSGAMITLVKDLSLGYDDLIDIALKSRNNGERLGATGMILKNHLQKFVSFLEAFQQGVLPVNYTRKEVFRVIKLIRNDICPFTSIVNQMKELQSICNQIENNR